MEITGEPNRKCPQCKSEINGRPNKIFCDQYCRSTYNYLKKKRENPSIYNSIKKQLNLNRKLLCHFNKGGMVKISKEVLINKGFNPRVFTHYWKNSKSETYLFCYEIGYRNIQSNGSEKYILIQWQNYMKNQTFN